jgi:hypothetical protein
MIESPWATNYLGKAPALGNGTFNFSISTGVTFTGAGAYTSPFTVAPSGQ